MFITKWCLNNHKKVANADTHADLCVNVRHCAITKNNHCPFKRRINKFFLNLRILIDDLDNVIKQKNLDHLRIIQVLWHHYPICDCECAHKESS